MVTPLVPPPAALPFTAQRSLLDIPQSPDTISLFKLFIPKIGPPGQPGATGSTGRG